MPNCLRTSDNCIAWSITYVNKYPIHIPFRICIHWLHSMKSFINICVCMYSFNYQSTIHHKCSLIHCEKIALHLYELKKKYWFESILQLFELNLYIHEIKNSNGWFHKPRLAYFKRSQENELTFSLLKCPLTVVRF